MQKANRGLRVDVLAVSHACVLAVNRRVYRELRRNGVDVHLVVPTGFDKNESWLASEPARADDPPIDFLPMLGKHGRLFRFPTLGRVLDKKCPRTVLVEADTASLLTWVLARWCRANGGRLICRTNENLSWRLGEALARGGWRELPAALAKIGLNWLVRKDVMAVCTSSNAATDLFVQLGFPGAYFVPMGTDRNVFRYSSRLRRETRANLGLTASDLVIAYFGRMVPEKGVDTLICAMATLKDLRWRLLLNRFEIASDYAQGLERKIAEFGLKDRVSWASSRHGAIANLMTASDVVVLPSLSTRKWVEQYGRVVPEAMACGNLLVVSDSGAPKELIGNSGLIFPEGDHTTLSRLLREIAADPAQCIRRRRAAIRHVGRELSIAVEARAYKRLVERTRT
jgi:glycosyltransferase involved in cell wall biosynthesis